MMMSIFDAIYHGLREATWQTRLVIILFVPISSMISFSSSSTAAAHQSMFSLTEWLHLYHRPTLSQLQDYSDSSHHRFKIGIIREAYVLDLTTLPSSSSQSSNDIRWENIPPVLWHQRAAPQHGPHILPSRTLSSSPVSRECTMRGMHELESVSF